MANTTSSDNVQAPVDGGRMPGGTRWAGKTKDWVITELERRLAESHQAENDRLTEIRSYVEAGYSNPERRLDVLKQIGEIVDADPIYLKAERLLASR